MTQESSKTVRRTISAARTVVRNPQPASPQPKPRVVRIRPVPAVNRAAAILHLLAKRGEGLTVSQIARELQINVSTCLHIMRALTAAHLAAFDSNGKLYRLGLEILSLASRLSAHDVFIQAAQPRLAQFANDFSVSASAQQRDGDEVVVVASVVATEGLASPLGRRVPCLSAAAGRLYATSSEWNDSQLRAYFERVRWQNRPHFDAWMNEVKLAQRNGFAIDEGQFRLGVTSIAAAIPETEGNVLHTISINVVSAQMDEKRRSNFIRALQLMARDIAIACR